MIEQTADLIQFARGGAIAFEGTHGEFQGRAAKGALGEVADEFALGGFAGDGRFVDVDAVLFAAGISRECGPAARQPCEAPDDVLARVGFVTNNFVDTRKYS